MQVMAGVDFLFLHSPLSEGAPERIIIDDKSKCNTTDNAQLRPFVLHHTEEACDLDAKSYVLGSNSENSGCL